MLIFQLYFKLITLSIAIITGTQKRLNSDQTIKLEPISKNDKTNKKQCHIKIKVKLTRQSHNLINQLKPEMGCKVFVSDL